MEQQEIFKYSKNEDRVNVLIHGVAAFFSFLAIFKLVDIAKQNGDPVDVLIFLVYGISMFCLFLFSSLYHGSKNPQKRYFFRHLDHISIYILIVGTYAPFTFSLIQTPRSYMVFILLLLLSSVGIFLKICYIGRFKIISTIIYIILGWLIIFDIHDVVAMLDLKGLILIICGGIVYSGGAIIYALSSFEYHHALWHLFVVIAAFCFYLAIINHIF